MKAIRILLLLLIAGLGFAAPAAHAASADERLVGAWEEYRPASNVIQFFADHTVKLYLTEEEGGQTKPATHYIGGTWSIASQGGGHVLTMHLSANGKTMTQVARLSFEQEEMVMRQDDMESHHRRLAGELPAKYVW